MPKPKNFAKRLKLVRKISANGTDDEGSYELSAQEDIRRLQDENRRLGAELKRAQRENPSFDFSPMLGEIRSCVRDGWHLIDAATGATQLFDTRSDPEEHRDVIEQEPARANDMLAILDEWREHAQPHPATEGLVERHDPEVEKRLRGMGYF